MALNVSLNPTTGTIEFDAGGGPIATIIGSSQGNLTITTTQAGGGSLFLGGQVTINPTTGVITLPGLIGGVLQTDLNGVVSVTSEINATALGWTNPRKFTFTGDLNGSAIVDGTQDVKFSAALPNIIGGGGPFTGVVINAKGLVTQVHKYTTLSQYGITDAVPGVYIDNSGDYYLTLPDGQNKYFTAPTQQTGYICIRLPVGFNDAVVSVEAKVLELDTGKLAKVTISGQLDASTEAWINTTANIFGSTDVVSRVLLGSDSSYCYIFLRNATGIWNGVSVVLTSVLATGSQQNTFVTGYDICVVVGTGAYTMSAPPTINEGTDAELLSSKPAAYYLSWVNFQNTPTTLSGYGITDSIATHGNGTILGSFTVGAQFGTQTLSIPNGTVNKPALGVIGDPTTGMFFGALNSGFVGFTSKTNISFEIIDQGNFRFGNTTPARNLFMQTGLNGTLFNGAAITSGGFWVNQTANQLQTAGNNGQTNSAVSLVLNNPDSAMKFAIQHLSSAQAPNAASFVGTPNSLFEVWAPQGSVAQAKNFVRLTAASLGNGPVLDVTGQDANINLTIASRGTGNIIFASPLQFNSNVLLNDASIVRLGEYSTVSANTKFSLLPLEVDYTSSGQYNNPFPAAHILSSNMRFVSGAVEQGTRTGLRIDWLLSDSNFHGTLEDQRSLWVRHGNYDGSAAGIISTSYGAYIEMPGGGMATTQKSWGIYQTSVYSTTQNYLGSGLIIGADNTVVLSAGEVFNAQGNVVIGGTAAFGGKALMSVGSIASGAHRENAANPGIQIYRNLADFYEYASEVTGTLKITLPFSWSNTNIVMKVVMSFIYDYPSAELVITGTNQSLGPWINTSASSFGPVPGNTVRLAYDGTHCCILIGTVSTVWNFPTILVKELITSGDNVLNWDNGGIGISFISTEAGLSTFAQPTINSYVSSGSGGSGGSTSSVLTPSKIAVRAVSMTNLDLTNAPSQIDSVTLNDGDRVLINGQTDATQTGIYIFNGAGQAFTRSTDTSAWADIIGALVTSVEGNTYKGVTWLSNAIEAGSLGASTYNFYPLTAATTTSPGGGGGGGGGSGGGGGGGSGGGGGGGTNPTEAVSVSVLSSFDDAPIQLAGSNTVSIAAAMDYSLDGGQNWSAIQSFSPGGNWSGQFPTLADGNYAITVRDHNTLVQSPGVAFTVRARPVNPPETITLNVLSANYGSAMVLAGTNTTPYATAFDYSLDQGTTWTACSNVSSGAQYQCNGPTWLNPYTGTIRVRDHNNQSVQSSDVAFTVRGGTSFNGSATLRGQTTNGETLVSLTTDGNAANGFNEINVNSYTSASVAVTVVASSVVGSTVYSAQWTLSYGLAVAGGQATLIPIQYERNSYSDAAVGWVVFLNTNGTILDVDVIGADGLTVNWTANVSVQAG